jgi:lipoprotein NlpD
MQHLRMVRFALLVCVGALTACGGHRAVPSTDRRPVETESATARTNKALVSEKSSSLRQPASPIRTVVHGDTLYSIAWETGRDYRELATWNRIPPPYTIRPGQELRVTPPAEKKTPPVPEPAKTTAKSKLPARPSTSAGKTAKAVAAPPATVPAPKTAGVSTDKSKTKTDTRKKSKTEPVKSPDVGKAGTVVGSWTWPTDGQVLKRFNDSDSGKGLDIGGNRGQAVKAAAGGRVVYQGSGLRGYGQLIIIKHSDEFLSAYAHNDRIHVKEGDVVKRGQKIADMGSTGTDRVKLHFEIRRQGVPTDPLKYLPKR